MTDTNELKTIAGEIREHLTGGIIPFWLGRGIDREHGGYLTNIDAAGRPWADTDKYIVTQTRMVWGLSALAREYPENPLLLSEARRGFEFLAKYFWDEERGGWFWKTTREGRCLDDGKVAYGQTFAIYALAEHYLAGGDRAALELAERTFDLLQIHCADTQRGGYYENMEPDWSVSAAGFAAGDRKSLDIHMHVLEAFTTLAEATGRELHRRKLREVIGLVLGKMIDSGNGCGGNQYDLDFNPLPAIDIRRTWNAERATGETVKEPKDTTSYGHNLELVWLLNRATDVLGEPFGKHNALSRALADHALKFGFDHELGGIYRDGPHHGEALVRDKEWWQNSESLVGWLDVHERVGGAEYLTAFVKTWEYDKKYFINAELGEWRQLLTREGGVLVGDLGNPWKAIYHTGRSMLECARRLERMVG